MAIRGELFTTQVTLDKRNYFFNVKENRNGDVFLQIVESKKGEGVDFDRHQVAIFAEDMQKFLKGLESSLSFIDKEKKERARKAAEKKAAKEAKYSASANKDSAPAKKTVYRRKGESRLVAEKRAERQLDGVKRTGKVHVISKRKANEE